MAVFATARKLAALIYRLLRWGQPYVDEGAQTFEERYHQQRIRSLAARAKELGYQLLRQQPDAGMSEEVTGQGEYPDESRAGAG